MYMFFHWLDFFLVSISYIAWVFFLLQTLASFACLPIFFFVSSLFAWLISKICYSSLALHCCVWYIIIIWSMMIAIGKLVYAYFNWWSPIAIVHLFVVPCLADLLPTTKKRSNGIKKICTQVVWDKHTICIGMCIYVTCNPSNILFT